MLFTSFLGHLVGFATFSSVRLLVLDLFVPIFSFCPCLSESLSTLLPNLLAVFAICVLLGLLSLGLIVPFCLFCPFLGELLSTLLPDLLVAFAIRIMLSLEQVALFSLFRSCLSTLRSVLLPELQLRDCFVCDITVCLVVVLRFLLTDFVIPVFLAIFLPLICLFCVRVTSRFISYFGLEEKSCNEEMTKKEKKKKKKKKDRSAL